MTSKNTGLVVRNILIFVVLVNGLAWLGPVLGGSPAEPGLGLWVWGTAPIVSALIMRYLLRDNVDMGWRLHLRGNGRYYLLSLAVHPLIIVFVILFGLAVGVVTLNDNATVDALVTSMLPLSIIYFIFAIFEEVGWRGYLAPSLFRLNNRLAGHAVVGLIWASWHLPYLRQLWAHSDEGLISFLPRLLLGFIVFSVLYGEIRLRTNSVWPAVLMHWSGNTVANTLLVGSAGMSFITLDPVALWLVSVGLEGALVIGFVALLGGILYRRRTRLDASIAG